MRRVRLEFRRSEQPLQRLCFQRIRPLIHLTVGSCACGFVCGFDCASKIRVSLAMSGSTNEPTKQISAIPLVRWYCIHNSRSSKRFPRSEKRGDGTRPTQTNNKTQNANNRPRMPGSGSCRCCLLSSVIDPFSASSSLTPQNSRTSHSSSLLARLPLMVALGSAAASSWCATVEVAELVVPVPASSCRLFGDPFIAARCLLLLLSGNRVKHRASQQPTVRTLQQFINGRTSNSSKWNAL